MMVLSLPDGNFRVRSFGRLLRDSLTRRAGAGSGASDESVRSGNSNDRHRRWRRRCTEELVEEVIVEDVIAKRIARGGSKRATRIRITSR
eukprot:TRINITY_DN9924_c0_g1_i1.p1 TRINITY_DN9924_c0_g1~~TRINITY_DN9924_c0_g1_i1.p1  ORF type:complete len:90 (-),score=14.61 TRINITY_DN9924_c0_g1_i1:510-779(-)